MMAMSPYNYAYEKLLGAVDIMATGKGSRTERLARATHQYLFRIRNQKTNKLPNDLAEQMATLIKELTSVSPSTPWDNAIDATTRTMSWQKAERLSRQLLSLFISVGELRRTKQ
jgi:hypothetical protein